MNLAMKPAAIIPGLILAAVIGYLIGKPIYDILEATVSLSPFVMLGVGIIAAVVLIRVWAKQGKVITVGTLLMVGGILIVAGIMGIGAGW